MTALATIPVDVPAEQWASELARWETLLSTADLQATAEALDRARLIREVVRIRRLSADIAVAAQRAEACALRRLAQLDALDDEKPASRVNARYLAQLPDDRFTALLSELAPKAALSTIIGRWVQREADHQERGHERSAARDRGWRRLDADVKASQVRSAVRALVMDMLGGPEPTSDERAARALVDAIGLQDRDAFLVAGERIIRKAFATHPVEAHDDAPAFITVNTSRGWVRIPLWQATSDDLRWALAYRETQVAGLLADIEVLEAALARREQEGR